ncbi:MULTISPECIES: 3-hydroxyacyl-CoA dehydrogenase [Nonomuraea]|uniref:3-hydroxyacyl-CoA dehydrogenase NAD-binding domain-containing protein n=1 Tax=Nonomuraea ferruginea TaxID=46174 RepID=A0ABT4T9Q7_9ACTN|nr:3-hydroxyacyl-CoA dehydrogenase NAD-binding domain-containing protein [Nonomuraea ferruginea]MDA0646242.1 3-hydroxyacyl-CoA dehydrogenase NAD-binding domain-containing protein [Nonomuraea ferruginea]
MTRVAGMTVAVAGLGPMGRGIARVFDRAGARVVVCDVSPEATEAGLALIRREAEADGEKATVEAGTLRSALREATLFVEAVVENMEAKAALLAEVRAHGRDDLVVASNTSSLSVGEMGKAFGDPSRVIGLHFFNPPTKMRLVEVIKAAATADEVHENALGIVRELGKTPVTCADSPNFVVNRVCRPLYYEAQLLVMQGLEPAVVDAVARGALGHRMGPLELLDFTGLHTHLASSETAHREFGDPRYRPIPLVRGLVRNGMTGRAAGRGFYDYAVEPPRDGRGRVTRAAGPAPEGVSLNVTGPHAAALRGHPAVARHLAGDAPLVVFSCHRAPTPEDVEQVRELGRRARVVVDGSDAAWRDLLPADTGWVRLHAWREEVFAEVVEDPEAGVAVPDDTYALLDLLGAAGVRVLALPGLVADRLADCLANEAYAVVEEGTARPEDVDLALRLAMNHPEGPFAYVRRAGPVTVASRLRSLLAEIGDSRYRPTQLMRRQVSAETRRA